MPEIEWLHLDNGCVNDGVTWKQHLPGWDFVDVPNLRCVSCLTEPKIVKIRKPEDA